MGPLGFRLEIIWSGVRVSSFPQKKHQLFKSWKTLQFTNVSEKTRSMLISGLQDISTSHHFVWGYLGRLPGVMYQYFKPPEPQRE